MAPCRQDNTPKCQKILLNFILITNAYVRYDHGDCCLQQIKGTLSKPALLQFSIPVCRHRGWLHGDRDSNQMNSRVSRGNETNVKTQLFRREENKRLVSFCRGMFTLLTNLSVPRRNETNDNFIVISFISS